MEPKYYLVRYKNSGAAYGYYKVFPDGVTLAFMEGSGLWRACVYAWDWYVGSFLLYSYTYEEVSQLEVLVVCGST